MVASDSARAEPEPRHVAFLRGINLGNRRVKMAELRGHVEALGLEGVATFLASGNVVFDHPGGDLVELEKAFEDGLEDALGYDVRTLIRPLARLAAIPGLDALRRAQEEGLTPHVIFVRGKVDASTVAGLRSLETDDDRFHALDREVVWLRRGGIRDAPFSTRDLERALGDVDNTMRNLNTVRRLVEKFGTAGGGP